MTIEEAMKKVEREEQVKKYIDTEKNYEQLDDRRKEEFLKYKLMEFIEAEHGTRDCLGGNEVLKEWEAYDVLFPSENKWEGWNVGKFAIFANTGTVYKIIAHTDNGTPIIQVVHKPEQIGFANKHIDLLS